MRGAAGRTPNRLYRHRGAILAAAASALLSLPAYADAIAMWSASPVSGDWDNAANWQGGNIPAPTDTAIFGATANPAVAVKQIDNARTLQFSADAPDYDFSVILPSSGVIRLFSPTGPTVPRPAPPDPGTDGGGICACVQVVFPDVYYAPSMLALTDGIVNNSPHRVRITTTTILAFTNTGNAANADIVAGSSGYVIFSGSADAGAAARLTALAGGTIDFSRTSGPNGDYNLSAGSIAGAGNFILGTSNLTTGILNDSTEVSGIISGLGGSLTKAGTGTLTLSGTSSYTGMTTVLAGTLNVTGSLPGSSVIVANGGILTGHGSVGSVQAASGGTVYSGSDVLSVRGGLTLAPGAIYIDDITPVTTGVTSVFGSANLGGAAVVHAADGAYTQGQRYTIITSGSGLSGVFSTLTTSGLPSNLRGRLGYDSNNVYLYLDANALTPLLPPGANRTQEDLAAGIDRALRNNAVLSPGFQNLFSLSGDGLTSALRQLSGQVANDAIVASTMTFAPYLAMLTSIGAQGGSAGQFAPGASYDMPGAPHPAQANGDVHVWVRAFGGSASFGGDVASGTQTINSGVGGLTAGVDAAIADNALLGASLGLAHQSFFSGSATGHGNSHDVMLALYGRQTVLSQGYLSAALAYAWHDVATMRLVTVAGADLLGTHYHPGSIGGRIEAGYGFAFDGTSSLSPYFAFVLQRFDVPGYSENALSGAATFALRHAAYSADVGQSEAGVRYRRDFAVANGAAIVLDAAAAWEHELDDARPIEATFVALPGSDFPVPGTWPSVDTALLGLGLHVERGGGLAFGVDGNLRAGGGTTMLTGSADFSMHW